MDITDEMVKAADDAYMDGLTHEAGVRASILAVAPLIAAQARERIARYIDRAVTGKRETAAMGLTADTIVADAWAEAAGWLREDSIWNAR